MSVMDIPLQFHEFQHLNHIGRCPKYTETLQKQDTIQPNDMDALYTDLENLQGASNIRLRRLEDEIKILTEWCDKKDRLKTDLDLEFLSNVTASKRSRTGVHEETKTTKKQKVEEPVKAGSSKIRSKGKATADKTNSDVYVSKPRVTYDAPNKFWSYVEPYCADVIQDDIRTLEESLTSKVDVSEYFKIPPLGRHYSEVWAKEDFIEEQQQSAKTDKKRTTPISNDSVDTKFMNIDLHNAGDNDETCPYGSFTQRLVSALVDENIMAPMTEIELKEVVKVKEKSEPKVGSKKVPAVSNAKSLENVIREELYSLGLIDSTNDDDVDYDADDEILVELRKYQSELKALRSHNKHSINRLIGRAKAAMKKQEVRQKAKVIDAELVDIFRRFSSSKAKKKGYSRKDRETAWKAIREREAIWKLVDSNETEKQE